MLLPKRNEIPYTLPDIKHCNGQIVVTLKDIDAVHQRPTGTARKRFNDNKKYFIPGIDYFVRNSYEAKQEYNVIAPNGLTLLTESGYLMVVKSFTDDLSWQVQRQLVNNYFHSKEVLLPASQKQDIVPVVQTFTPLPDVVLTNPIGTLEVLLSFAHENKFNVRSQALKANYSRLHNSRIGIAKNLTVESVCYELAYELSHAMLYPDIDVMQSPYENEYNQRAKNAALMLLNIIEHSSK